MRIAEIYPTTTSIIRYAEGSTATRRSTTCSGPGLLLYRRAVHAGTGSYNDNQTGMYVLNYDTNYSANCVLIIES